MIREFGKICLALLVSSLSFFAQTLQPVVSKEATDVRTERQSKKSEQSTPQSSTQKRRSPAHSLSFFKQKRNKEQQKQLLPSAEDVNHYGAFLQQPGMGLIKLIDDIGCHSNAMILRADEECLKSIPGGSFYSFREREYSSSALADLRLKDGLLITDGVFSQNILVKLGDVPLENISLASDGMKFLNDFLPESNVKEANKQYVEITKGIRIGKFEYSKVYPSSVNTTYAMRLVAYKGKIIRRSQGFAYNVLSDDRLDALVAFRIVRKDKNGITLIWKELGRKKAPKLEVPR